MIHRLAIALAAALGIAGCLNNPINVDRFHLHYARGKEAERAGDLHRAAKEYFSAWANAHSGMIDAEPVAYSLYDYARIGGVVGKKDADWAFREVLKKIERDPKRLEALRTPALAEYSRFLHETGQDAKAVTYYARALAAVEITDIELRDPIGFARFLTDYSESSAALGHADQAQRFAERAEIIKRANPGRTAEFDPPPYSTVTPKSAR